MPSLPPSEAIFNNTSDAVLWLDASGKVRAANSRVESLFGCGEDDVVGFGLERCISDFKASRAEAQIAEYAKGSLERRVDHFSPSRYTWYEIRVVPMPDGALLFARDITDRMRQTRSEAVREGVRQIIIDAPVAISITRGPEHRYELVNAMAQRLIGNRQVEGRTARSAFPEIDPALFDLLDKVYSSGEPVSIQGLEVAFDREGTGELTPGIFDVTYQPLVEADGTVSGILSVSVEARAN